MTVFEAKNDAVVVTRNGRPVAAIQAISDDDVEERYWSVRTGSGR